MMDFSFLTSWWFIVLLVLLGTTAGYRIVRRIPLVKAIPRNFYFLWWCNFSDYDVGSKFDVFRRNRFFSGRRC